jgi:hypothetical protein
MVARERPRVGDQVEADRLALDLLVHQDAGVGIGEQHLRHPQGGDLGGQVEHGGLAADVVRPLGQVGLLAEPDHQAVPGLPGDVVPALAQLGHGPEPASGQMAADQGADLLVHAGIVTRSCVQCRNAQYAILQ